MKKLDPYFFEYLFVGIVVLLSITGFWKIYFGADAKADAHHLLHTVTNAAWLVLLMVQLRLIGTNNRALHRKLGLSVLLLAPLLVATTAMLSVHSAQEGLASGRGDFMIVQNVMVTLELALVILLAFFLRRRRKLHGYFMLSTAMLFMGIALFFTLISFVPAFRIEGPETFYRFGTAAMAGQAICLVVGLLFLARDFRNAWPLLLAAVFFLVNEFIRSFLAERDLMQPLTEVVGSMSQAFTFIGSFVILLALPAATGIPGARQSSGMQRIDGRAGQASLAGRAALTSLPE